MARTRWSLDGQRVMRHEFMSEAQRLLEAGKGALEPFVSDDEGFALEADGPTEHHVKCDQTLDRLLGVNESEGDLVAANDAVAHALLFADLLNGECRGAPGIRGSRLLMA